jgi:hypothetical protein
MSFSNISNDSEKEEDRNAALYKTITDDHMLLQMGLCRARVPMDDAELQNWANEFSQVTPEIIFQEGDGERSFYRNIKEEAEQLSFFNSILSPHTSDIGKAIQKYFLPNGDSGSSSFSTDPSLELELDDAFCIQYTSSQLDTSCAKHVDPSDITVNMCLEGNTNYQTGSQVVFYGKQALHNIDVREKTSASSQTAEEKDPDVFCVDQLQGYATIHWGCHPHMTTPLLTKEEGSDSGCTKRTNIILTYCFKKKDRKRVLNQNCFFPT